MNVLDLGFVRAIQTLQERTRCKTIDELIDATLSAWTTVDAMTLNSNFLTLQTCLIEVVRTGGGNNYKIPHMGKKKLAKQGLLPESVECPRDVFNFGHAAIGATDFDAHVDLLAEEVASNMKLARLSSNLEHLCLASYDADEEGVDTSFSWFIIGC
ncbi:hypothetical protein AaE_010117 [Aphanomyces astaci]|uniref:Uncharacterized protein n=1 Tax=Aphanomyces astaci TaxID=112090 RepID=A0A6A5A8L9_APHAT|nr:hypothetical protein AaE_010117 [Aphanomyces astaci]